jgi:spore germination protein YaaH
VSPTWSEPEQAAWFATGSGERRQVVWLSDARSLAGQLGVLPTGQKIGLWHLGGEDPAIWPLLAAT